MEQASEEGRIDKNVQGGQRRRGNLGRVSISTREKGVGSRSLGFRAWIKQELGSMTDFLEGRFK